MSGRKMTDSLITAMQIEDAIAHVCEMSYEAVIDELRACEPALVAGIRRFPQHAISGIPEPLSMQTRSQIQQALWRAILVAYRCQRHAHYRLWAGTELGGLLGQLDPTLRNHAVRPPVAGEDDGATGTAGAAAGG